MLTDATSPEVRRSGIGGSDSAAICGESPWATPLDVYLSKRGLVEKEQAEAAEWGQILEPTVLRQYALRQGVFVVGRGEEGDVHGWDGEGTSAFGGYGSAAEEYLNTIRDPNRHWRMCHLDGLVIDEKSRRPVRLVEGKTSGSRRGHEWGESGTDEVPQEYVIQAHHNAGVFAASSGLWLPVDIPVLIGGSVWKIFTINPDPTLDQEIFEREQEFWENHILQEEPPPATSRDKKGLSALYPVSEEEKEIIVEAESDLGEAIRDLREDKNRAKMAEDAKVFSENLVKERMQDASVLVGDFGTITWKTGKDRQVVDWKAIALGLEGQDGWAELKALHTTGKSGFRTFRTFFKEVRDDDSNSGTNEV